MANVLQPYCSSIRSRYWPNVNPNADPESPWKSTDDSTIHQP